MMFSGLYEVIKRLYFVGSFVYSAGYSLGSIGRIPQDLVGRATLKVLNDCLETAAND